MIRDIDLATLRGRLGAHREFALLDVREAGQFGAGHIFAAVPLPYSRLELEIGRLAPNRSVAIALCDGGDGIARRAALRLAGLGFDDLNLVEGGPPDWRRQGLELFEGVNTVSKTFGELVDHACATPRIAPVELHRRLERGDDLIVVDGRPFAEYRKMNIPGSICCPNGELALRIAALAPDPATTIVVNCAGRTRSIVGAQTLIDLGVPNPVAALENGTQGWFLADLPLEHGATRRYGDALPAQSELEALRERTRALMERHAVPRVDASTLDAWLADLRRTTYLFDVRTQAEVEAGPVAGAVHAPGGQLLQATDQWVGVRGARIVILDQDGVRAGVVAKWLRQMGHDARVLEQGGERLLRTPARAPYEPARLPGLDYANASGWQVLDLRGSMAYREGHAPGARWSIRPRVAEDAAKAGRVALVSDDPRMAALAAVDLRECGVREIAWIPEAPSTERTPHHPPDTECIDHVFFTHRRHEGDRAAAEQYLRWETNLVDRVAPEERSRFRV